MLNAKTKQTLSFIKIENLFPIISKTINSPKMSIERRITQLPKCISTYILKYIMSSIGIPEDLSADIKHAAKARITLQAPTIIRNCFRIYRNVMNYIEDNGLIKIYEKKRYSSRGNNVGNWSNKYSRTFDILKNNNFENIETIHLDMMCIIRMTVLSINALHYILCSSDLKTRQDLISVITQL